MQDETQSKDSASTSYETIPNTNRRLGLVYVHKGHPLLTQPQHKSPTPKPISRNKT